MADRFFLDEYRMHVAQCSKCGCNLDGPDRECNLGWALWKVANQTVDSEMFS